MFAFVCLFVCCLCQIDLTEALESWAAENLEGEPVWSDASFTLKYYSDALFDFPHWFGFSRRHFKVIVSCSSYVSLTYILHLSAFFVQPALLCLCPPVV